MQRCCGCMREFGKEYDVCPYCGYVVGTEPEIKSHLFPGTKLAGRYVLGKAIGHGGFGITYIAWDDKIQKAVAIKEYFPNAFSTRSAGETQVSCYNAKSEEFLKQGIQKMLDEARRLSKFYKNENIVDIFDFFEENNTAYIVMEYLEGKDLKKYFEENGGKLDPEKAVKIILPVINALEDMHKENFIHRDVSPDNIFLCDNGKIKLLDFGSARLAVEDSDKSFSVMVKRGYAPKEQYASRSKQGPWTDVYAVCATLYRMITGELPVESTEREDEPLQKFSEFGIIGYDELEKVVFKGLEVDHKNRTQTVSELKKELTESSKKKSAIISDIPKKETVPASKKKINVKAIIAAVAAIGVVAGIILAVKFVPWKNFDKSEITSDVSEEISLTLNASEAKAIYEKFLSSDDLKDSYPTVNAFIKKDISLLSQDKKEEFDTEIFGINNLDSSVVCKEYYDFDNDGIEELLLSVDIDGEKTRMNVYLFDIDADKKVFEGALWEYIAPSRMYNHISVIQNETEGIYFVEFTNDGNHWRGFVKSVYDGEKIVPIYSLSIPDHQLAGYATPDFAYCDVRGKSLHSPMGRHELEYPEESEITSITYENAYSEMEKLFDGTRITGFCDGSWADWEKIKISESGKINDGLTWKLYENGYLMIEGKGKIPEFDANIHEKIYDRCPWKELRNKVFTVGVSKGITHINDTFAYLYNLENAFLPDGTISIGDSAFADCYKLSIITIPDSVTSIGNATFYNCNSLESITIPDGITSIGDYAFEGCGNIASITIPNGVTSIGEYAFEECTGIVSVTISNGVKVIGDGAFQFCHSLASITIPNSVTSIGDNAFCFCSSLENIVIPRSVAFIGYGAFSECSKLKSISVDSENNFYSSDKFGALYNKNKTTLIQYPAGSTEASFEIPNGVTSILCAFEGCSNLTSITIPDSVTHIDSDAFSYCNNLKEITIPGSVSTISGYLFENCDNLESVILLDGVKVIGNYAFEGCKNLKSITIPSSVTSIENNAFFDCECLTDVYYSGSQEQWNSISIEYSNQNLTKAKIWYTDSLLGFVY